nr:MAG TPA: Tape measure domain protein [Caudoviricetes sp.]
MSKLSFDVTVNSSDFIEKMEQIRSAMLITSAEMEKYSGDVSLSFQQMADKISLNVDVVGKIVKDMHEQVKTAISSLYELDAENQSRLEGLRKNLSDSKNDKSLEEGNPELSVGNEINSRENLSEDITNQSKELAQLNAELVDYQQKIEAAKKELLGLQEEMDATCGKMEKMRNSVQQNTQTYEALKDKSEDLLKAMKHISVDATFEGITSGLGGLSSAFSTASSMLELFSIENETLQNIMQKVQLAIAVTNGLQEVNAVLSKESAFQLNIVGQLKLWWRNITLQAAVAQGIETTAASAGTVVNLGLAGSFRAIGLAIKSIPGIGWILAGISALIGLYSLWSSQTKEQKKEQEQLNESLKKFNEGLQGYAASPIATIELLSAKFKALGDDINAQKKFIEDSQTTFDNLGLSIKNVKDAEQALIDNKEKFIEAQIAKATSLAYQDILKDETKKYIEERKTQEKWEKVAEEEKQDPNRKVQKPQSLQEYKTMQEQGMINEEGNYLTLSERMANAAGKRADGIYKNMQSFIEMIISEDNKASEILVGIIPGKKTPKPQKEEQVKEARQKYLDLLENQEAEKKRFAEDSVIRIKQAKINEKPDGPNKDYEQLILNQEKEKLALEREKEELKRKKIEAEKKTFDAKEELEMAKKPKHTKGEFNASEVDFKDIDQEFRERDKSLNNQHLNERLAYNAAEKQAMHEHLKDYGTYEEKRKAIIALSEEKKKGKNEWEQKTIDKEKDKSLSELDMKAVESSTAFGQLFSDVKERSVKDMHTIVDTATKALEFIKGGKWDAAQGSDLGISKESFDALQNSSPKIDEIKEKVEGLNQQANASDTAFNKMGDGFKKLFNSDSDPKKLKEALGEIEGAMNEVIQSVQFFSNCLSSLGDAFGSDALSGIAEGMNVAMDAASSAMSGAQAGAAFGPWGAAAGAAIGLVSSLGSSLAKLHDAKHEKSIQQIQEQIEVLEKSYENLGDSLDKAFSSDASELIDQQNTLLEQQKVLIRNQIAEEKSKKKTDWGRIDEWEKQIEDIDKVIAGNKEKKIDVIFGEDLKAAIENFAQAYAEAWSAGDDKAKSSKELVKNMIKQMITEAIKAASSKPMEELRKRLAGFFSDGIISDWERQQIEKDAEAIAKDLDRQFGWADEYMKGDEKESSSQDSTKGGFASMSQETGDELNGRFTALQISNEEIKNSMFFIMGNLSSLCTNTSNGNILLSEMRNLAVMSNGHLEDIAKYTKVLLGFGEKLDNIAYNTKSLIVK